MGTMPAGFVNAELLVSAEWLQAHLNDPIVRILDVRPPLQYRMGHLPHAVNLYLDVLMKVERGVPGIVIGPAEAEAVFSRAGIDDGVTVVAYADRGGASATRAFWTLEYHGHPRPRVLAVDFSQWVREGRPVTTEVPQIEPRRFQSRVNPTVLAQVDYVRSRLGDGGTVLLDTRSEPEYRGEVPAGPRPGHIPGARNLPWDRLAGNGQVVGNVQGVTRALAAVGATPQKEIVTYCMVGERSSHTYFVLRLLGYPRVLMYDGSMAEWGPRRDLPIEV